VYLLVAGLDSIHTLPIDQMSEMEKNYMLNKIRVNQQDISSKISELDKRRVQLEKNDEDKYDDSGKGS